MIYNDRLYLQWVGRSTFYHIVEALAKAGKYWGHFVEELLVYLVQHVEGLKRKALQPFETWNGDIRFLEQ